MPSLGGRGLVSAATEHDHTSLVLKALQKRGHQDEMTDVICEKLRLIAVLLSKLWQGHDPGVANDGIQRTQPSDRFGARSDRLRLR